MTDRAPSFLPKPPMSADDRGSADVVLPSELPTDDQEEE